MNARVSMNVIQLVADLKWLWTKITLAVAQWYTKQIWLKTIVPFKWYEDSKFLELMNTMHQESLENLNITNAGLQKIILTLDDELTWAIEHDKLNSSAKTTAMWMFSILHPDVADVSRETLVASARKR